MNYQPAAQSLHSHPHFPILEVDVLDRQSLYDLFQTPIFFSTIAIVSLNIQSLFGPYSGHHSQSAIDNLNH